MKAILLLLLIGFLFSGCGAIKKAIDEKRTGKAKLQFDKHPDTAAHYCSIRFPLKDSIAPINYVAADNKDYTKLIDSLLKASDSLSRDSITKSWTDVFDTATTAISEYYKKQLRASQKQIAALQNSLQLLHDQYKPCKPDTVKTEHYIVDGAAVANANAIAEREKSSRIKTEAKNTSLLAKLNWWKIACLITWAIVLIIIIILIFKPKI